MSGCDKCREKDELIDKLTRERDEANARALELKERLAAWRDLQHPVTRRR